MRIIAGLLLCTISTGALAQAVTQPAGTFLATPAANAGYLGTRLISPSDLTQWYGAACDGSTDDTAALNAALSSAKGVEVVLPQGKSCESFTGITVPSGARLVGQAFNSEDPTLFTGGSRIQCPQNIPNPCVTIGSGNTGANSASMQGVIVQGLGSATMTQGIGVKVDGVTGATLRDVMSYNFYDGYDLKSYNQAGLGAVMENVHTGVIADAHILVDSWPETHVTDSQFGVVGGKDLGAETYVRFIQASHSNLSGGANTFTCVSCQFNESGTHTVTNGIEFVTNLNTSDGTSEYKFIGMHMEHVSNGIYSDSSWTNLTQFYMVGSEMTVNGGAGPFFALNAATSMTGLHIQDNQIAATVTLANAQLSSTSNSNIISGNTITGAVSLTGNGTGGQLAFNSNNLAGGFSIAGAGWTNLSILGNTGIANIASYLIANSSTITEAGPNEGMLISGNSSTKASLFQINTSLGTDLKIVRTLVGTGGWELAFITDNTLTLSPVILCPRTAGAATSCNFNEPVGLPVYTIANLPSCGASQQGFNVFIHDTVGSTAAAYHGTPTGGGATTVNSRASCTGAAWQYD